MSLQTIAWIAAAVSAFFSAVSAAANWYNANTFRRQLKNTTIDACVSAAAALKAAVYKTIELKANKIDKITDVQIWGAYDDAWAKWVALFQTFQVARRYKNMFMADAPDQASALLSELRGNLRDPNWIPGGAKDPRDSRAKMDAIVVAIEQSAGLAS
ncbi:hypothetical protein V1283_007169 [Bradyrhizobium sp. AZCC 2262]|uniref:hypothetical protein n=1 Tax=Bradyrhizobium sp. AZCC 2262 TaxID=3117022 RepID=UPI002FF295FC